MKKGLLLALAIVCFASFAYAQGSIAIYGDTLGTSCEITDVYVITLNYVHVNDDCAIAVEFKVDVSGLTLGTLYGHNISPRFPLSSGSPVSGLSLAYNATLSDHVIWIGNSSWGSTAAGRNDCGYAYTTAHPEASVPTTGPLAAKCGGGWLYLNGGYAVVSRPATGFSNCPCPGTVPNEESSWGQIKSLYQ